MTYDEYIAQQQQAIDVTVSPMKRGNHRRKGNNSCFLTEQPEGQFVRGH